MKAFLIVDMQNDFMPEGALAVPEADELIPVINQLMGRFAINVASQDWHPSDHVSFAENHHGKKIGDKVKVHNHLQELWPRHCVQQSLGAELVSELKKGSLAALFLKGVQNEVDSYSAFFDNAKHRATGLGDYLRSRQVTELYVAGVALDYCVLATVVDALELGFATYVVIDGCKAIHCESHELAATYQKLSEKGAKLVHSSEISREHAHLN